MKLISTVIGTARLMSDDGMHIEDPILGIYDVFQLLTKKQQDGIYRYAETNITDEQEKEIRELAGV